MNQETEHDNTSLFDSLMKGLDEVDAFLAGETAGYQVNQFKDDQS